MPISRHGVADILKVKGQSIVLVRFASNAAIESLQARLPLCCCLETSDD